MPEISYTTTHNGYSDASIEKINLEGSEVVNTNTPAPSTYRSKVKTQTGLFIQVPLELLETNISPSALKLYMMLLKYARQSQECWPSHQTLARDMNLKSRRIANLLKELDEAGLIKVVSRASQGQSNLYQLHKVVHKGVDTAARLTVKSEGAYPPAENCYPGKQKIAGEGMQHFANEAYAVELHSSINNNHNNIQKRQLEKSQPGFNGQGDTGQDQTYVNVVCDENKNEEKALIGATPTSSTTTFHNQPSMSLEEISASGDTIRDRVVAALTAYGVAQFRARQLAPAIVAARLDERYIQELADWISSQAALRKIYNPAGFLVQMVYQLAPVPVPASTRSFSHLQNAASNIGISSNNQHELNLNHEVVAKHLPRLIEIEQRNLEEASCERDRTAARSKLDKLLALQDLSRFNTNTQVSTVTATSTITSDSYPRYVQVEQESPKENYA